MANDLKGDERICCLWKKDEKRLPNNPTTVKKKKTCNNPTRCANTIFCSLQHPKTHYISCLVGKPSSSESRVKFSGDVSIKKEK